MSREVNSKQWPTPRNYVELTGRASVHPRIRPFSDEFQGDAAEFPHDCEGKSRDCYGSPSFPPFL